jgi:hypothetical protein
VAEKAEKARADELKRVSEFQSQILGQIDTTKAGVDLTNDVRARFAAALEKEGVPEAERATHTGAFAQELVRVNATDAAAALIDRTIPGPAIRTIGEQFGDQPAVDAQLRHAPTELYRSIGLNESAVPLQESTLATRRRALGEEHPHTLVSLGNMGILRARLGKPAEAEAFLLESFEKRGRALGEQHPLTVAAIGALVDLYTAWDKPEPGRGHGARAAEWQAKLDAAKK